MFRWGSSVDNKPFLYEKMTLDFQEAKSQLDALHWQMADIALAMSRNAALPSLRGRGRPKTVWTELSAELAYAPKTLEQWAYTAGMFPDTNPDDPYHRRKDDEYLTFHHHLLAAYSSDPARWIELAEQENLSLPQLRAAMRAAKEDAAGDEDCEYRVAKKVEYCQRQGKPVERDECSICTWACRQQGLSCASCEARPAQGGDSAEAERREDAETGQD